MYRMQKEGLDSLVEMGTNGGEKKIITKRRAQILKHRPTKKIAEKTARKCREVLVGLSWWKGKKKQAPLETQREREKGRTPEGCRSVTKRK